MAEASTPLMRQYQSIKARYPHALVLFRLGDFYELFHEDAIVASRELQITLTSRNREKGEPIPMCGVPHHAAENYMARLIRAGYKIAVCDQLEEPGPGKKLVRRDVVRVITPGTATDLQVLEPKENNFLVAISRSSSGARIGLAYVDVSTGEFRATEFADDEAEQRLHDELQILAPREILVARQPGLFAQGNSRDSEAAASGLKGGIETRLDEWIFRSGYGERILGEQFGILGLEGLGLAGRLEAISAAGALLHYLRETSGKTAAETPVALLHLEPVRYYEQQNGLVLDPVTVRNLEIMAPLFDDEGSSRTGGPASLLGALDETVTSMGGRLLRSWILRPEADRDEIAARLDGVAELKSRTVLRGEIRQELRGVLDLERLASRATLGIASPRDLAALRQSLERIPLLRRYLESATAARLQKLREDMDDLADFQDRLKKTLTDDPPALASDPGVIRRGVDSELDQLRDLSQHSRLTIAAMEERERKRSGIASLKIRYNQVFGYYLEVSNANLHLAPADFERKQTLANAERFTTPELKEYERRVLAADESIAEIERRLFSELRSAVAEQSPRLRRTAAAVAQLDLLANLALVAAERNYARPEFCSESNTERELLIVGGRHPVIERLLEKKGERFVPNSLYLNGSTHQILLITGPNMGGKSTYLRQAALIVILAQIGSFVPAERARLPLTDRIFTRIGASDNLARGRSTFLVEMSEVAAILNLATPRSLVLLDEVGRGTATFDGLSIAWAVVEHLQAHTRASTLFATHYHELTELADLLPGVKNIHVAVQETPNEIVFLRRIEEGSANKSYGIEVARLAGLPAGVIERAREILRRHEQSEHELGEDLSPAVTSSNGNGKPAQEQLFTPIDRKVLDALRTTDLDHLRPLDALNLLAELKKQIS